MKMLKYSLLAVALIAVAAIGVVSCGSGATFSSMTVTPANPIVSSITTTTVQFRAMETLSDGETTLDMTSLVSWGSSNSAVATISGNGLASIVSTGTDTVTTTITAIDSINQISASAVLTVVSQPTLTCIKITPADSIVSLATRTTPQFHAFWNDTSIEITSHMTWSTSDTSAVTISNTAGTIGLATLISAGTSTIVIYASDPVTGVTGTTGLKVDP